MPSWLLGHSTPHLWTRFSDEGFKTFLGGGYVTTLITGIFLSGIGKIFLLLRGKGGRLCWYLWSCFLSREKSTYLIHRRGGGGGVLWLLIAFFLEGLSHPRIIMVFTVFLVSHFCKHKKKVFKSQHDCLYKLWSPNMIACELKKNVKTWPSLKATRRTC